MYDWPTVAQAFSGAANPDYLRRYMSGDIGRISFESAGALFPSLVYLNKSNNASAVTIMCGPSACTGSQISTDGNRIAFATGVAFDGGDANAHADVYVYDVDLDTYTLVSLNDDKSQGNGDVASGDVALSGDGALIAFSSGLADNFAGSGTANALVLRNIDAGTLTAVSVNDGGGAVLPVLTPRPALSDEGTILAFTSNNTALAPHPNKPPADALVRNMKADLLRSMCRSRSGNYGNNTCFDATVSADGLWGAFTATADNLVADDTNNQQDVFVVSLDVLFDDIFADGMEH
jgi:Tol biopolymer transport system component